MTPAPEPTRSETNVVPEQTYAEAEALRLEREAREAAEADEVTYVEMDLDPDKAILDQLDANNDSFTFKTLEDGQTSLADQLIKTPDGHNYHVLIGATGTKLDKSNFGWGNRDLDAFVQQLDDYASRPDEDLGGVKITKKEVKTEMGMGTTFSSPTSEGAKKIANQLTRQFEIEFDDDGIKTKAIVEVRGSRENTSYAGKKGTVTMLVDNPITMSAVLSKTDVNLSLEDSRKSKLVRGLFGASIFDHGIRVAAAKEYKRIVDENPRIKELEAQIAEMAATDPDAARYQALQAEKDALQARVLELETQLANVDNRTAQDELRAALTTAEERIEELESDNASFKRIINADPSKAELAKMTEEFDELVERNRVLEKVNADNENRIKQLLEKGNNASAREIAEQIVKLMTEQGVFDKNKLENDRTSSGTELNRDAKLAQENLDRTNRIIAKLEADGKPVPETLRQAARLFEAELNRLNSSESVTETTKKAAQETVNAKDSVEQILIMNGLIALMGGNTRAAGSNIDARVLALLASGQTAEAQRLVSGGNVIVINNAPAYGMMPYGSIAAPSIDINMLMQQQMAMKYAMMPLIQQIAMGNIYNMAGAFPGMVGVPGLGGLTPEMLQQATKENELITLIRNTPIDKLPRELQELLIKAGQGQTSQADLVSAIRELANKPDATPELKKFITSSISAATSTLTEASEKAIEEKDKQIKDLNKRIIDLQDSLVALQEGGTLPAEVQKMLEPILQAKKDAEEKNKELEARLAKLEAGKDPAEDLPADETAVAPNATVEDNKTQTAEDEAAKKEAEKTDVKVSAALAKAEAAMSPLKEGLISYEGQHKEITGIRKWIQPIAEFLVTGFGASAAKATITGLVTAGLLGAGVVATGGMGIVVAGLAGAAGGGIANLIFSCEARYGLFKKDQTHLPWADVGAPKNKVLSFFKANAREHMIKQMGLPEKVKSFSEVFQKLDSIDVSNPNAYRIEELQKYGISAEDLANAYKTLMYLRKATNYQHLDTLGLGKFKNYNGEEVDPSAMIQRLITQIPTALEANQHIFDLDKLEKDALADAQKGVKIGRNVMRWSQAAKGVASGFVFGSVFKVIENVRDSGDWLGRMTNVDEIQGKLVANQEAMTQLQEQAAQAQDQGIEKLAQTLGPKVTPEMLHEAAGPDGILSSSDIQKFVESRGDLGLQVNMLQNPIVRQQIGLITGQTDAMQANYDQLLDAKTDLSEQFVEASENLQNKAAAAKEAAETGVQNTSSATEQVVSGTLSPDQVHDQQLEVLEKIAAKTNDNAERLLRVYDLDNDGILSLAETNAMQEALGGGVVVAGAVEQMNQIGESAASMFNPVNNRWSFPSGWTDPTQMARIGTTNLPISGSLHADAYGDVAQGLAEHLSPAQMNSNQAFAAFNDGIRQVIYGGQQPNDAFFEQLVSSHGLNAVSNGAGAVTNAVTGTITNADDGLFGQLGALAGELTQTTTNETLADKASGIVDTVSTFTRGLMMRAGFITENALGSDVAVGIAEGMQKTTNWIAGLAISGAASAMAHTNMLFNKSTEFKGKAFLTGETRKADIQNGVTGGGQPGNGAGPAGGSAPTSGAPGSAPGASAAVSSNLSEADKLALQRANFRNEAVFSKGVGKTIGQLLTTPNIPGTNLQTTRVSDQIQVKATDIASTFLFKEALPGKLQEMVNIQDNALKQLSQLITSGLKGQNNVTVGGGYQVPTPYNMQGSVNQEKVKDAVQGTKEMIETLSFATDALISEELRMIAGDPTLKGKEFRGAGKLAALIEPKGPVEWLRKVVANGKITKFQVPYETVRDVTYLTAILQNENISEEQKQEAIEGYVQNIAFLDDRKSYYPKSLGDNLKKTGWFALKGAGAASGAIAGVIATGLIISPATAVALALPAAGAAAVATAASRGPETRMLPQDQLIAYAALRAAIRASGYEIDEDKGNLRLSRVRKGIHPIMNYRSKDALVRIQKAGLAFDPDSAQARAISSVISAPEYTDAERPSQRTVGQGGILNQTVRPTEAQPTAVPPRAEATPQNPPDLTPEQIAALPENFRTWYQGQKDAENYMNNQAPTTPLPAPKRVAP